MKNKKVMIIGGILTLGIGGFLLYVFMSKKNKNSIPKVLQKIAEKYGVSVAQNVEKIYRLETNNFKSDGFNKTKAAGMIATQTGFPFGWTSLSNWWKNNPEYIPVDNVPLREGKGLLGNGGSIENFLRFKDFEGAAFTLAEVLKRRGNNAGAWFSTIPENQNAYNRRIESIKTEYV